MKHLIVREYLRVSKDVDHAGRSPDQQHRENVRVVQQRGWILHPAPPYRDTDRSASRYAKKPREDFERLISDLEANEFGADVLALWESSRGSRRVGEWVDLVDLCKLRNVGIWVTTHDRLYDPANARDRRSLLEDAVDSEYESDKTSERRKRSARASAEAGKPHGRNTYGYLRVYDERTRELLRVEPHPDQAPVVQEAARRVLQGDTFYSIARDLNARGVPPRAAKRLPPYESNGWTPSGVKQMLRLPAYAGKRDYRGAIVGDGMWPALIEFNAWTELQALVAGTHRKGPRDHTAKYLLSNIAQCGVCGAPMKSGRQTYAPRKLDPNGLPLPRRTYHYYTCAGVPGHPSPDGSKGWHTGIKADLLDEIVVSMVLARIADPDFAEQQGGQSLERQAERAELLKEIAAAEDYLNSVREQAAEARRFDLILDQEARVQPRIAAARERLNRTRNTDPFVQQLVDAAGSRAAWEALTLEQQRRVVRTLVTPVVHRVTDEWIGRPGPNPERVEAIWC
jgi:DNA invertase Pin-like site-specific DNA recombinase